MKKLVSGLLMAALAIVGIVGVPSVGLAKKCSAPDKAIVVVSFGTTFDDSRKACIESIEQKITHTFADYKVCRAFTSKIVMKRLGERGIKVNSLEETLDSLAACGVKEVILQPTHLTPGEEFDNKIISVAQSYRSKFAKMSIGRPVLTLNGGKTTEILPDDFSILLEALKSQFASVAAGEEIVFMGHGSPHRHNPAYAALQAEFDAAGLPVTIGVVEDTDHPNRDDVVARLKARQVKSVTLMPLMLVAGDHANNDMIGDEDDSWKNVLSREGFAINTPYVHGLGENAAVQNIYIQHIKDAINGRYVTYIK